MALAHLADGSYPDVSTRDGKDCYLSDATGNRLTYQPYKDEPARAYDLKVIESVIHELPQVLFIAFQGALAAYWGQDSDAGVSRWKWLATVLHNQLRRSSVQYSAASARQLQILKALTTYPDRQTRASQPSPDNTVYAYTLETQLRRNEATLTMSSADLLVISGTDVLLCRTSGQIESFTSVDAFGEAWCKRTQQRFYADSITWRQYEPDGNIFEVQAALILNQQLEELAAIKLPGSSRIDVLETLFATITNPSLSLGAEAFVPQPHIQAVLPYWLKNAAPSDRFAYRQYLLEQALLTRTTFNDTDLDQLDSIDAYASSHLDHQLCLDRNNHLYGERRCSEDAATQPYKALELELTFHVAVGGLEGGYIEPVSMNLVELALKNLSGRPKGRMTIRHTGGQEIEAWLTPDYIFQLVQRVDIGLNYPNYIREKLLSDTPAVKKRQRLYIQQRPLQLNIQALEHKIRGEAGFTHRGIRLVAAAFKPCASERWVDDDEIVLRPLAFVRKPGATADVVQNMFIIEPKNPRVGPHLLYHPAGRQSMREFTDRASLLAAIVQPGELQDSVLAWLTDSARPVYSNGGFIEPHYVRIGIGSEFDILPSKPSPATLADADDESSNEILQAQRNNTLMAYLFNCDAHQLVDQAERDSTSNTESRWALIVEGLQLGFNTLLMAVRGPIAAVGWMLQLMGALKNDLPELESDDPTARELAWIDLLMNISMLLLHSRTPNDTTAQPRPLDERTEQLRVRLPFRRSLSATGPLPRAVITRGTIGLPSEPPGGGHTVLDFDRSLATDSA
ncbi:dermonecrotic toxin domain-containing protein, partial [Pseudomonas sp.]|uniref:dermonecrotic toxin domain-containing protein n=1 Tax=Pseudomonas sp. TaxID=306 RepID=UPI003D6E1DFD